MTSKTPSKIASNIPYLPILTLDDAVFLSKELRGSQLNDMLLIPSSGHLRKGRKRIRDEPFYLDILNYILEHWASNSFFNRDLQKPSWKQEHEIYVHFPQINHRTLKRYLKRLQELKWLRLDGKDYHLNPFLWELFKENPSYEHLLQFARLKVDLFDLLNLPIIEASKHRVIDSNINYTEIHEHYYNSVYDGKWKYH
jgi:hypothetical protein